MDYNITDKWKVFGRVARYNTTDLAGNPTPNNSQLYVPTGTSRGATNIGGDAIGCPHRWRLGGKEAHMKIGRLIGGLVILILLVRPSGLLGQREA